MLRKILIIGLVLLAAGGGYGYYLYNKPLRNVSSASADFVVSAEEIYKAFATDTLAANKKYNDKVIVIKGIIDRTETDAVGHVNIYFQTGEPMASVSCQLDNDNSQKALGLKPGDEALVKGECDGYLGSDLLPGDVIITRAVLTK